MTTSTGYEVSYNPSLTPLTPHITYNFITELEDYVTTLYTERVTKVADGTPLLSSVETPYYENTELDLLTAYSIDARNIHKWLAHFLVGHSAPNGTPQEINFDVPPKKYTQTGNTLFVETAFGEIAFEIETTEMMPIDVDDTTETLTINYGIQNQDFSLVFEETGDFDIDGLNTEVESDEFNTSYDEYHSQLSGWDAEQHQPFAIYSPSVPYKTVKKYAEKQTDNAIVLVTEDDWQVCVRSPDETDYEVNVNLVELLNPVSNKVVEFYESFAYPQRFIHLPEIQYLDTLDATLTDAEKQQLRVLPYAIPFGKEELLFEKLSHSNQFTRGVEPDSLQGELCYEQFFEQTTDSL